MRIKFPPVQADLLGLVNGADQQANADGEQFNIGERNTDIAGDYQTLVQHPVENVNNVGRASERWCSFHWFLGTCWRRVGRPCSALRSRLLYYVQGTGTLQLHHALRWMQSTRR